MVLRGLQCTVVPPPSLLVLLYSPVLTVEGWAWSYVVGYRCAPSLPFILPYYLV